MKNNNSNRSVTLHMGIALISGVIAGLLFLFLKNWLNTTGHQENWQFINNLLFQNITADGAEHAIGLFYIIGQLFIKSLQFIIIPMVFTSIAIAMQKISNITVLKRIAFKTIKWFLFCYILALLLACTVGMICYNAGLFSIGVTGLAESTASIASNPLETVLNIIPSNIIEAFSSNNAILSVVFLAVVCGLAMNYLKIEKTETLSHLLEEINSVTLVILNFVTRKVGPIGTFVLITTAFATYGTDYLIPALSYLVVTSIVLLFFLFIVYPLLIWISTGMSPTLFMKKIMGVLIFAFSTTSSAAVLPLNMEVNTKEFGVKEEIASFVLPLGMTINMNGTAIMQVIATLFIAGCGGYEVTVSALILIAFLTLVTSAGTPATSGAGGIILFTILSGVGYTNTNALLAYTLILAINKPIGMLVTALNVVGDSTACLYVDKTEKN